MACHLRGKSVRHYYSSFHIYNICAASFISAVFFAPMTVSAEEKKDSAVDAAMVSNFDIEAYGSLRLHISHASVDEAFDGGSNSYTGLTDAYSRVGARGGFDLGSTRISANIELGLNTAELDNIGYPVDYFSTIYAGYTTYAFFREKQVSYTTPSWNNFTGTLARIERTGGGPLGWHYVAAYANDGFTVAVGAEDMDGTTADTKGASVSYQSDGWYLAAKYEESTPIGEIYNGFVQYTDDRLTYKFGLGLGDQFSGNTFHTGIDFQFRPKIKFFTEFYKEELNYAILQDRAQNSSDYFGAGGFGAKQNGKVFAFGLRYDFSTTQ